MSKTSKKTGTLTGSASDNNCAKPGDTQGSSVITTFDGQKKSHTPKYQGEADISQALVIKAGNLFMLLNPQGDADVNHNQAEGLYFHDCRFLSRFILRLGNQDLNPLLSSAAQDEIAEFELVNPAVVLVEAPGVNPLPPKIRPGQPGTNQPTAQPEKIPAQSIGVSRKVVLAEKLTEQLTLKNFNREKLVITLNLEFDSDFLDIFTIRGTPGGKRGNFQPPESGKDWLKLSYHGADKHLRYTLIHFEPVPTSIESKQGQVLYQLELEPLSHWEGKITISLEDQPPSAKESATENSEAVSGAEQIKSQSGTPDEELKLENSPKGSLRAFTTKSKNDRGKILGLENQRVTMLPLVGDQTDTDLQPFFQAHNPPLEIESPNQLFNRILKRCFNDLFMLLTHQGNDLFFAAGVPWFVTLFGRDSLITALETLVYNPGIAAGTLRLLASYQGQEVNDWKDEQPGKILHELRVGERANLGEIPFTPYYGTVDATPLFLILMGEYLGWTADYELFQELLPNVRAALQWIERYGDIQGEGFVEYAGQSGGGLANQGWKDSGNSIVNRDGSLVEPPVALVEVQGYVYKAKRLLVPAFRVIGDDFTAQKLELEAEELKEKFNEKFWIPDANYYALALQKAGNQAGAIASNPGQALWAGIVPAERACLVCERLFKPDMFNGWGIRTLSANEKAYNPYDYQIGAVWPHDNAIIAAGLKQHGFGEEAAKILTGLFNSAGFLPDYRLPEVFTGIAREVEPYPVKYPVACRPQAWAAGSIPFILTSLLGLEPDIVSSTIRVVRPVLPEWLPQLTLYNLALAKERVTLEFIRTKSCTEVRILERSSKLDVEVVY